MIAGLLIALAAAGCAHVRPADRVLVTFAAVGDSREAPTTPMLSQQDRRWLQGTRAWGRILREVAAQHPTALFFLGDMIHGYTTDVAVIDREYAFWRGMAAVLMEAGVYVVPVPGNHEVQELGRDSSGHSVKFARASLENAWRANMGDLIIDEDRWRVLAGAAATEFDPAHAPRVGSDGITTDQSKLTYSFDFAASHFAVINTDPVGYDGHAPVSWLADDLAAARGRGARHLFVFGHKPAFTYRFSPGVYASGLDAADLNARDSFWRVIERERAVYICGHEHIFHAEQPTRTSGGRAWQIIAGSGGTPLEARRGATENPMDRMYAWALIHVCESGRTHFEMWGFDDSFGTTRLLAAWDTN